MIVRVLMMLALGKLANLPAVAAAAPATDSTSADAWVRRSREVASRGLMKQAIELADRAVQMSPSDPGVYHHRALLYERTRQLPEAERDLTRAIELDAEQPTPILQRALVRLRIAAFAGAVADFDRYVQLRPSQAAGLWQRGIALFYGGRYDDARRQFEIHRTVNPRDVENSAWHYACIARLEGVEAARRRWMPVSGDPRVPMEEIQALMRGTGSQEAVLSAAEALKDGDRRAQARFYAHLYLALFFGAEKDRAQEARHAAEAAKLGGAYGIMGEIAKLHADWVVSEIQDRP
jgi:lipoprotein NlpI